MLKKLKEDLLELRLEICRYLFKDNFHEDPLDCIKDKKIYIRYKIKQFKFSCLKLLTGPDTIGQVIIYTFIFFVILNISGILIYNDFFYVEAMEIIDICEDDVSIKIVEIEDKIQFSFVKNVVEENPDTELKNNVTNTANEIDDEEKNYDSLAYNEIIIDEKDIPIPPELIKFREEEAEKLKEKVDLVFIEYVYSIFDRTNDNLAYIIKMMFDISYEELMTFIFSVDFYFLDWMKKKNTKSKFIRDLNMLGNFSIFVNLFYIFFFIVIAVHSLFSLYSVYVDYFQKTSAQRYSSTGFLIICIIFILLFFILFCIFYFIFKLYYIRFLWIMFL